MEMETEKSSKAAENLGEAIFFELFIMVKKYFFALHNPNLAFLHYLFWNFRFDRQIYFFC
jgi:hypothetical protein